VLKNKCLIIFICLIVCAQWCFATHNKAGEITYRHIKALTYEFTITTYTVESSSQADRDSLDINWGDGTMSTLPRVNGPLNKGVSLGNDIKRNEYVGRHSFPGTGQYRVFMEDPNRNAGIQNISGGTGSVNIPFYLEDVLNILDPQFFGVNSSPVLLQPPIDFAYKGQVFIHNPNAYDPDGDSLSFEFITPQQALGIPVPSYLYPDEFMPGPLNNMSLDSITGEFRWDVPPEQGIFNVAFLIKEHRRGQVIGTIIRDIQIDVLEFENLPPIITEFNDTCIVIGDTLNFQVFASDQDSAGQISSMTATGGPLIVPNPATFITNALPDSQGVGNFSWLTNCDNIRRQDYQVLFKASDNFMIGAGLRPLSALEAWRIKLVAPPPENLTINTIGHNAVLTWNNPYDCASIAKFKGFSVWRLNSCDTSELDACQNNLSSLGYVKLADKLQAYTYTDAGLTAGNAYTYRVMAHFADTTIIGIAYNTVNGAASEGVCVEFNIDVPLMIKASVAVTDSNIGVVEVGWAKPRLADFDTINNPGPYFFELYRSEAIAIINPALVYTSDTSNYTTIADTSFIDSFLNTVTTAHNYYVVMYGNNGLDTIPQADDESTIFLNIAPDDNQLTLSWSGTFPWINYRYDVYKESGITPGVFDSIGTTTTLTYVDDNLINDSLYCYYIKSYGSYTGNNNLPKPLINLSQIRCERPKDTVAACAPNLIVENDCDLPNSGNTSGQFINRLIWNNPNNTCAEDVVGYNIYVAEEEGDDLVLTDSIRLATDTQYAHISTIDLEACFAVTAIDSFGNESELSNIICTENCPQYQLPNVFTPNGDGANDLFYPTILKFVDEVDMKIYNRWGNLLYETNDPNINWDGTDQATGKLVDEGVYFYGCEVIGFLDENSNENLKLSGYIHVILSKP